MRTLADRIRHAISFEVLALLLIVPLASFVFHQPMHDIGVISVVSATIAMLWNVVYNFLFDLWLKRKSGSTLKSRGMRVLHAMLFEGGLLVALMPFIAWYLQISLAQAFVMDVSFALFYMGYAYAFNWGYDWLFPLPEWKQAAAQDAGGAP
ncbi:PACE efflux transporter [Loktanella salsilacus]|uniref:PACE efflux transporter n=1 Tax=Loktanella salsilacus TaxID=195913 RepID=UPI0037357B74